MRCNQCGTENEEGTQYCQNCGAPMNNAQPNGAQPNNAGYGYAQGPVYGQPPVPEEYKPISMWGYFGYELLFAIPCIGFIMLLVFSFGATKNVNLKNFARSYFCFLIVCVVLAVFLALTGIAAGIGSSL